MFENARVTVEADILIFDPYKVTATGGSARIAILSDVMSEDLRERLNLAQDSLMVSSRNLARDGD